MSQIVSTSRAAEMLEISPRQVARLVVSGKLEPLAQAPGKRGAYLFHAESITNYIADRDGDA